MGRQRKTWDITYQDGVMEDLRDLALNGTNQERQRATAMALYFLNYDHYEIADMLNSSVQTVSGWIDAFQEGGIDYLLNSVRSRKTHEEHVVLPLSGPATSLLDAYSYIMPSKLGVSGGNGYWTTDMLVTLVNDILVGEEVTHAQVAGYMVGNGYRRDQDGHWHPVS